MPGSRAPGQKQVLVMMKQEFLEEIDGKLGRLGYDDRSAFIRAAVYEKMEREGVKVPKQYHVAPSRTGKGGAAVILNEATGSPVINIAQSGSGKKNINNYRSGSKQKAHVKPKKI